MLIVASVRNLLQLTSTCLILFIFAIVMMIMLLQAIVRDCRVLLLDEATAALGESS